MIGWLQRLANAILGRVPGKVGRFDTATRMMRDADFRGASCPVGRTRSVVPMPSQRLTLWKNFSTHSRAMRAIQTFRLHFLKPPTALVPSVLLEGSLVAADLHATIQAAGRM